MDTNKKFSGYPSIDKPWLKYYSEENVHASLPAKSMYQYLYDENCNYMKDVAMLYLNTKITYGKLFKNIDMLAEAFSATGIKKGDTVTIISLNTPETFYVFYALNKIGAVACMEYVTQPKDMLYQSLLKIKPKLIVILNLFLSAFDSVLRKYDEKVLVLSPLDSLPFISRVIGRKKMDIKMQLPKELVVDFRTFIAGKRQKFEVCVDEHASAALMSTSGSTGVPKKVMLTNRNINSIAFQYKMSGMNINRRDTFISMAPPFHAFGIALTLHLPLCMGVMTIVATNPSAEKCSELFVKHNPNHVLGSIEHVMSIIEHPKTQEMNLKHLYTVAIGGESVSDAIREKINSFLHEHNADINMIVGYGMTELSSTAITEKTDAWKNGSVGIPQTMVNVKIIDEHTGTELTYGQNGEILVSSPGMMKEYIDNEDETKKIKVEDEDGNIWIRTGDLGCIDEDGMVYIKGRIKRIFWTKDINTDHVFKLFPDYIEGEMDKLQFIKRSAVIAIPDRERINVAVAFVVLSEKIKDVERCITEGLKESVASYDIPSQFLIVEEIPLLTNGKIDYCKLEEMVNLEKDTGT